MKIQSLNPWSLIITCLVVIGECTVLLRNHHISLVGSGLDNPATLGQQLIRGISLGHIFPEKPSNVIVGINGFSLKSLTFDIQILHSVVSRSKISVTLKIGPNVGLEYLDLIAVVSRDGKLLSLSYSVLDRVKVFSVNLTTIPAFTTKFSTGDVDVSYDFSIPYTPPDPSLFTSGARAFVTFSSLAFDPASTVFNFKMDVIEVTDSIVKLRLSKFGDCRITRLMASIVVISQAAGNVSII